MLLLLVLSLAWTAGAARAQQAQQEQADASLKQAPVTLVVELFSSQGCSACPPADRLLARLAQQPGVVAMTLPVDYWDYLGWKDTFASSEFVARQKAYAAARGDGQIYTPQMVLNGLVHVVGRDENAVRAAAGQQEARTGAFQVPARATLRDGALVLSLAAASEGLAGPADILLFRLLREREVTIRRGENRNRTFRYVNIVHSIVRIGVWDGNAADIEIPRDTLTTGGAEGWAILVQSGSQTRPGAILAAAKADGF